MTAPTEAEIRASIEIEGHSFMVDDFAGMIDAFRAIMDSDLALTRAGWADDYTPADDHPGTLWADMTRDEVAELQDAMHAVLATVVAEATGKLVDGCVAAAVEFSRRHPDIPRGRWQAREAVTA